GAVDVVSGWSGGGWGGGRAPRLAFFRLHHKQKKAAPAGAAKPAPLGPRRNGALVIVVDVPSGNPGGEAPLHRPAAVKSLAQLLEVDKPAGTERAKLVRVVAHVP